MFGRNGQVTLEDFALKMTFSKPFSNQDRKFYRLFPPIK